jgi:hypothetical protein
MLWALGLILVAARTAAPASSTLAADVTSGADLILRVSSGELAKSAPELLGELEPLVAALPSLKAGLGEGRGKLVAWWSEISRFTGVDLAHSLAHSGASVTLVADLDAKGGPVWAALCREATSATTLPPLDDSLVEERTLEGQTVRVAKGKDLAWVQLGTMLVVGSERGVQRQLRHLGAGSQAGGKKDPPCGEEALCEACRYLRRDAPVMLAFSLSTPAAAAIDPRLAVVPELLRAGALAGEPTGVEMTLLAAPERQPAAESLVRGALGALSAASRAAQAMAELSSGARLLGQPALVAISDAKLESALKGWLRDLKLEAVVRPRPQGIIEATVTLSDYRGLLASLLLAAAAAPRLLPVHARPDLDVGDIRRTLLALRQAEQAFKKRNGRYQVCPPTPATVPHEPLVWPGNTCLSVLGFAPKEPFAWQLAADLQDGQLVLVARASNGDAGPPEVWYLDEKAEEPRALGGRRGEPED